MKLVAALISKELPVNPLLQTTCSKPQLAEIGMFSFTQKVVFDMLKAGATIPGTTETSKLLIFSSQEFLQETV